MNDSVSEPLIQYQSLFIPYCTFVAGIGPKMTSADEKSKWKALESSPEVLTKLVHALGPLSLATEASAVLVQASPPSSALSSCLAWTTSCWGWLKAKF